MSPDNSVISTGSPVQSLPSEPDCPPGSPPIFSGPEPPTIQARRPRGDQGPQLSEMQEVIAQAISQGIAEGLQRRDTCPDSRPRKDGAGVSRCRARHPSLESSVISEVSVGEEHEHDEQELSEDKDLPPDTPAFSDLFRSTKSILHKAKSITQLGTSSHAGLGGSEAATPNPRDSMFKAQAPPQDLVPVPDLFMDVVQCQWIQPGSLAAPSRGDKKLYSEQSNLRNIVIGILIFFI